MSRSSIAVYCEPVSVPGIAVSFLRLLTCQEPIILKYDTTTSVLIRNNPGEPVPETIGHINLIKKF